MTKTIKASGGATVRLSDLFKAPSSGQRKEAK